MAEGGFTKEAKPILPSGEGTVQAFNDSSFD